MLNDGIWKVVELCWFDVSCRQHPAAGSEQTVKGGSYSKKDMFIAARHASEVCVFNL